MLKSAGVLPVAGPAELPKVLRRTLCPGGTPQGPERGTETTSRKRGHLGAKYPRTAPYSSSTALGLIQQLALQG